LSGKKDGSHNKAAVGRMAAWTKDRPAAAVERQERIESRLESKTAPEGSQFSQLRMVANTSAGRASSGDHDNPFPAPATVGWRPTCDHPLLEAEVVPCTVLDSFAGSGRTLLAAVKLERNGVGIEVNPRYCKIAEFVFKRWEMRVAR
jgi:hypothetical protein